MPSFKLIHKPLIATMNIADNPDMTPVFSLYFLIHNASCKKYSCHRKCHEPTMDIANPNKP